MPLTFCRDLAAADWITGSDLPWQRLVTFGPAGFEAFARLRFLPDPAWPGQAENDVAGEDGRGDGMLRLFEVLSGQTTTPDDCWFCVWEGFGSIDPGPVAAYADSPGQPDARPGWAPAPAATQPGLPMVQVPHRAYWLFRGPLADVGAWDQAQGWPAPCRLVGVEPAFVWPADRAWCVARDVDPHWAGIGGSAALIDLLAGDRQLDVVRADPAAEQPAYR